MEHTTPYPHQRQQILARLLLTIWLPTICSPEATFATTSSAEAMASAADTSTGAAGPSTPPMGSSAEIRLIAQGGHQVTVQKNNDKWQAEVEEHLPTGFSSKLSLPVVIQEGMPWQQLATCSQALQRQRVVVDSTPDNGRVYIDSRGLWRRSQPLYEVIKQGALALVPEILEEGGVDIHAVDDQGRNALHWAVSKGYTETAALLLRHGANTELQDRQGKTPLDYADESGRRYLSAIVKLLQLFSILDHLIADCVIQNEGNIAGKLYQVEVYIENLKRKNIELYNHFTHRYHIQSASYLRALGKETSASLEEELAAEHQEPNVSLLSLDADLQETMAASSVPSQDAGPLLNDPKDDKSLDKEKGDNKWRQFMEYCCAQQDPCDVLTRLGRENPDHLRPGQKDALKDALLAHEFYGSSSHAAARAQHLRSEINLKAIMALRLSIIGCFLEATMYALSICSLLVNSSFSDTTVSDLRKAQALLARVQEAQLAFDGRSTTASSVMNTLHVLKKWNSCIEIYSVTRQREYFHDQQIHIKSAIAQDLLEIPLELLLGNARNLARPHVSEEKILEIEQLAKCYQQAGVGTRIVGGLLLCILVGLGGYVLLKFIRAYSKRSTPSPKRVWRSVFAAAITGILGVLTLKYGRSLWNKGESMMQESGVRRGLNSIIETALTHHDQGDIQAFFDTLSAEYTQDKPLFLLENVEDKLPGERIKEIFTTHGFSSDDAADLLYLMGKALSSGKVRTSDWHPDILSDIAQDSFQWALAKKLSQPGSAQDLDKSAEIAQNSSESSIKRYFQALQDFWLLREVSFLAREPIEDTHELSDEAKLAISILAKSNLTATSMRKEKYLIKKYILLYQLFRKEQEAIKPYLRSQTLPKLRLAAITDLLGVINKHIEALQALVVWCQNQLRSDRND